MTAVYSEHACGTETIEHNDVMLHTSIEKQVVKRDKCRRIEMDITVTNSSADSVARSQQGLHCALCQKITATWGPLTAPEFFYTATSTATF
jgi:hypothetical protein